MITQKFLSDDQARSAMENGGFPEEILASNDAVVLILTQSWCPQWMAMKMSLRTLGERSDDFDVGIYIYEYDKSPIYHEFMRFKEQTYSNWEVPYLRLYRNGRFQSDGNAMPGSRVLELLRNAV